MHNVFDMFNFKHILLPECFASLDRTFCLKYEVNCPFQRFYLFVSDGQVFPIVAVTSDCIV